MTTSTGWIGVDLDGTLAHYDRWWGDNHIGAPVPSMVERVKAWLLEGKVVKVFTARVAGEGADHSRRLIEAWCLEHVGRTLEVTNVKDWQMVQLWDDRAVRILANTGEICCAHP